MKNGIHVYTEAFTDVHKIQTEYSKCAKGRYRCTYLFVPGTAVMARIRKGNLLVTRSQTRQQQLLTVLLLFGEVVPP